jgi:hypothetical protein
MGRRTAAQRLCETVGCAGLIIVVVDAAGDGVPVATVRVGRVRHSLVAFVAYSRSLYSRGARRSQTCIRSDELVVARRARSAAGGAQRECCTARRADNSPQLIPKSPLSVGTGCVRSSRAAMYAHAQHTGGMKGPRGRACSCVHTNVHACCARSGRRHSWRTRPVPFGGLNVGGVAVAAAAPAHACVSHNRQECLPDFVCMVLCACVHVLAVVR